jgi:hypothetical protein
MVLPVTQVLASHVSAYDVPDARITVIPNGINRAHFAVAPAPTFAKAQRGLVASSCWALPASCANGMAWIVSFAGWQRLLRQAMCIWSIVGDGPVRHDLETLAQQLGLSDACHLYWRDSP